jgi:hypothetical protein
VDVDAAFGQHENRTPTHGYAPTREAAMAAFAKSCSGNKAQRFRRAELTGSRRGTLSRIEYGKLKRNHAGFVYLIR